MLTVRRARVLATGAALVAAAVAAGACDDGGADTSATTAAAPRSSVVVRDRTAGAAAPPSTTVAAAAPADAAAGDPASTGATDGFTASVAPVPDEVRRRMDGVSMRPGCPVGYDDLRYVRLTHLGFDGRPAEGELVVAATVADDVVAVFRRLYEARFPVRRMTLVDDFGPADDRADGGDDFASIEADNTSAFNCRLRTGSATEFSQHSYGTAIDLNPLENPYVTTAGTTAHARSVPYLDRAVVAPGVVTADGPAVAAFAGIGWGWGGTWSGARDLQHFSATGR